MEELSSKTFNLGLEIRIYSLCRCFSSVTFFRLGERALATIKRKEKLWKWKKMVFGRLFFSSSSFCLLLLCDNLKSLFCVLLLLLCGKEKNNVEMIKCRYATRGSSKEISWKSELSWERWKSKKNHPLFWLMVGCQLREFLYIFDTVSRYFFSFSGALCEMDGWMAELSSEQRLFYLWCVRTHSEQQSNGINRKQDAWLLCAAMRRERVCEFREILTYLALLRQSRALLRDEMMFSSSSSRPSWAARLSVCETREDEWCWSDNGILG